MRQQRGQRTVPPEWAERMVKLGFHHNNTPSSRRLAEAAGVTVGAVQRVIYRGNWGEDSVLAIGQAMRDPKFVADWVAMPLGQGYEPPLESRHLTPRQRVLVDELIRELANGGQSWDTGSTSSPEDDNGGEVIPFRDLRAEGREHAARTGDVPDEEH